MQDFEDAPPPADALVESLRGFGYSAETAIADIIDNSITARAKNVWVKAALSASTPYISILDDGEGMDEETLRNAMKLGSQLLRRREIAMQGFPLMMVCLLRVLNSGVPSLSPACSGRHA